jgi:fatty-acyl-CoA synthase
MCAAERLMFVADKIARYMIPKSIDFIDELPRLPTGKLYKKALRDRYRADAKSDRPGGHGAGA